MKTLQIFKKVFKVLAEYGHFSDEIARKL